MAWAPRIHRLGESFGRSPHPAWLTAVEHLLTGAIRSGAMSRAPQAGPASGWLDRALLWARGCGFGITKRPAGSKVRRAVRDIDMHSRAKNRPSARKLAQLFR